MVSLCVLALLQLAEWFHSGHQHTYTPLTKMCVCVCACTQDALREATVRADTAAADVASLRDALAAESKKRKELQAEGENYVVCRADTVMTGVHVCVGKHTMYAPREAHWPLRARGTKSSKLRLGAVCADTRLGDFDGWLVTKHVMVGGRLQSLTL